MSQFKNIMLGLVLMLISAGVSLAQVSEGNQPYVPTRLEWMEVYLNAGKSVPYTEDKGFGISYIADGDIDTLYMVVIVDQTKVKGPALESALASSRRLVTSYVKKKRWDGWLKFEERLQSLGGPVEPPSAPRPPMPDDSPEKTD